MMLPVCRRSLFAVLLLILFPVCSASAFGIPERLDYDLSWTGIKAGTASLEITKNGDGFRIVSTAESAAWVSVFYRVEDRVETFVERTADREGPGRTKLYRVQLREGRHRRHKEVAFDHDQKTARFVDFLGDEKKNFPISAASLDPLAGFYHLRGHDLAVGRSVYLDIFDSKKRWDVEVQILRRERLSTILGEIDTIVVKPLLKSEGIFSRKGDVLIWLTDDSRKIPVKLQSKVAVGAVSATLTKITPR